jgi:4-amino-4-deoxy-L-arabinose transferase-like glycosyltransferase
MLARLVLTDAILFFFSAVTMGHAYLGLSRDRSKYWLMAYAAAALAVLTKGPVGLVLPGLLLFAYVLACRDWRFLKRFRWGWGLAIFLLLVGPWYVWMLQQHGEQFVNTFLGLHNVTRATVSEHPEDNVFYYYLVLYPVSLLPWSGLLLAVLLKRRVALLQGGLSRYLWVWLGGTLLFYSLMATKYPTYVFPALLNWSNCCRGDALRGG